MVLALALSERLENVSLNFFFPDLFISPEYKGFFTVVVFCFCFFVVVMMTLLFFHLTVFSFIMIKEPNLGPFIV